MSVFFVVPREEGPTETAGIFDTPKAVRKQGSVLKGLELRFRIGIIITGVRTAVSLGDP